MAWDLLFSTDYGLFSVFVIAFVVAMAIWFGLFFSRKIREDSRQTGR
ncbi:MAG: DUF3149 domain-containing protein [Candidatus Accumulibacter sp.]|nr:DUF3149 domain-containing protein [Accumulibacter sp.]MDS4014818.1 DUF3149 domain-containing protein [Accumulibacter sp.]